MNSTQKEVINEMRAIASEPTLGEWSGFQRMLIGEWADRFTSGAEPEPEVKRPGIFKRAWDGFDFSKTVKWIMDVILMVLVLNFLFFGGLYFKGHLQSNMNDIDQVSGDGVSATCFQSVSGLSCLPTWLVETPEVSKPKTVAGE